MISLISLVSSSVYSVECGSVPIDNCVVTQDTTFVTDTYYLQYGIDINAPNIILDCNNATLIGTGYPSYGIQSGYVTNITIKNCNVENYGYTGIYVHQSTDSTITNNNVKNNDNDGFYLSVEDSTITHNTALNNKDSGFHISNRDNNDINNNEASNNLDYGFELSSTDLNDITQNTIKNNTKFGIYVKSSNNNRIWNNNIYDTGISYTNSKNNSYCVSGTPNHYYNGAIGPTCDGCYPPINGMIIIETTTLCTGTYNLSLGIVINAPNIILDCNNATLIGTGYPSYGIQSGYVTNITIKNCNVENYGYTGIYVHQSTDSTITNNNVKNNDNDGFYLSVEDSTITHNTALNNKDSGFHISNRDNNDINNNEASNNLDYGFELSSTDLNDITQNTIKNNTKFGIYVKSSNNNNITYNNVLNNYNGIQLLSDSTNNNINDNVVCMNTDYDIQDYDSNIGANNTCNTTLNWNDTGAVGCTYVCGTDLLVTDIKPIQTIQDIPLIKDKATMVRVFVDVFPEGIDIEELFNITVELEFEGEKYYETANLIKYDGKLYVVPDKHLENFQRFKDNNKESLIKKWLFDYGLDAFNFENSYKPEYPLYPRTEGNITISAKIDPYNRINESDEINNFMSVEKKVKSFNKNYNVVFRPVSFWGSPNDFTNYDILEKFADYQFEYSISTYPIPRGNSNFKFDSSIIRTFGVLHIPKILAMAAVYKIKGYDRVVFIVPEGKLLSILKFIPGFGEPPTGLQIIGIVLIDETAPQPVVAHEIGHTYGYCEEYDLLPIPGWATKECGNWDEDIYPSGYIAGDGWDVRGKFFLKEDKRAKISLDRNDPDNAQFNYFSFMGSLTGSAWGTDFHWAPSNNYEYNKYDTLLEKIIGSADPRVLVVSGLIYENDTVNLLPFYSFDGIPDILEPGNYSFECLSAINEVLCNVSFQAVYYFDNTTGENVSPFVFTIPYPDNTTKIVLKHYSNILKEVLVTQNMPVVEIISVSDLGNEIYEVIWNASDADGDNLTYSIFYSHNSDDWFPLVFSSNNLSFSYILNTSNLPGSNNNSFVKIVITDDINTVEAISNPFSVPNKPPSTFISRPLDNLSFAEESDIIFEGWAYDPEEFELNGSSFVWASSIDGIVGSGVSFTTSNLSLGTHNITLTVNDEHNVSDTSMITITILPILNTHLNKGWNLISIPLNLLNNSLGYALSSIEGNYGNVFGYFSDWHKLNESFKINETIGLWIKMFNDDILKIYGTLPILPVNFNLKQGYNLIGYPSLNESNISFIFENVSDDLINVFSYENSTWKSFDPIKNKSLNTLKIIKPGHGYWVNVNNNVSWSFDEEFN